MDWHTAAMLYSFATLWLLLITAGIAIGHPPARPVMHAIVTLHVLALWLFPLSAMSLGRFFIGAVTNEDSIIFYAAIPVSVTSFCMCLVLVRSLLRISAEQEAQHNIARQYTQPIVHTDPDMQSCAHYDAYLAELSARFPDDSDSGRTPSMPSAPSAPPIPYNPAMYASALRAQAGARRTVVPDVREHMHKAALSTQAPDQETRPDMQRPEGLPIRNWGTR